MREYYITIDDALRAGLRPEIKTPKNSPVLSECLGYRVGRLGLEGIRGLTNPLPDTVALLYSWPFPQFLRGEKYRILITRDDFLVEDRVYSLDETYTTATLVFSIEGLIYGQGTLMELADFGEYAFMTNGVIMLYWDPTLAAWDKKTSITTIPMMRTICNFKGQMVGGCVLSAWADCDEKSIVWSNIGSADFTLGRRNESGYRRDLFGGEVYHVRRLGDSVIVYSSKGITRMYPVSSPSATFGFKELLNKGVLNRGAVGGDLNEHAFVDEDYVVWKIDNDGLKRVGYQGYMDNLIMDDVIVTYDSNEGDFYFSDGTKTYLLSPKGLTEHPGYCSAVWYDGLLYGLPETDLETTTMPYIKSEIIDMGYRGQKTIFTIEVDIEGTEVAVEYRNRNKDPFKRTPFTPVNDQGVATVIISGVEFRIIVKSLEFEPLTEGPDRITVRWKMTDLRGLRGIYAAPPRGQSAN